MTRREHVLSVLRAHEADLRDRGILHLDLFGSTARGDDNPKSDIDLLAVLDPAKQIGLFDFVGLENHLSDLLGRPVDLIQEGCLRPRAQARVERDRIGAF